MQFCIDQENIKYQSILFSVLCLSANAWHSTIWEILTSEFWLRGSWVWHSDRPAIHGHAPPEPLSRGWQGLTWPHGHMNTKAFTVVNDFEPTPCDTWMSKLRARPQTEPSCKGLAVTLLSGKVWQGSLWDKQPGIQEIGSCSTSTIAGRDKTLAGHRKF